MWRNRHDLYRSFFPLLWRLCFLSEYNRGMPYLSQPGKMDFHIAGMSIFRYIWQVLSAKTHPIFAVHRKRRDFLPFFPLCTYYLTYFQVPGIRWTYPFWCIFCCPFPQNKRFPCLKSSCRCHLPWQSLRLRYICIFRAMSYLCPEPPYT